MSTCSLVGSPHHIGAAEVGQVVGGDHLHIELYSCPGGQVLGPFGGGGPGNPNPGRPSIAPSLRPRPAVGRSPTPLARRTPHGGQVLARLILSPACGCPPRDRAGYAESRYLAGFLTALRVEREESVASTNSTSGFASLRSGEAAGVDVVRSMPIRRRGKAPGSKSSRQLTANLRTIVLRGQRDGSPASTPTASAGPAASPAETTPEWPHVLHSGGPARLLRIGGRQEDCRIESRRCRNEGQAEGSLAIKPHEHAGAPAGVVEVLR